jgi:AcrR family transcriptional regulator
VRGLPDDVVAVRRTGGDGAATSGEQTVDGTRERVLEAALVVLRDVGYGQFSVQKVAREAGVYQGNITYYWPRRRDLVLALAVRIVDDYRAAFVAGFHGIDVSVDGWAESVVRAIVDDAISEDRVRLLPELWSMANSDPEIADVVRRVYEDIPGALLDALGIAPEHPRRGTIRAALALICMAAQGLTAVHGHRGSEDPRILEVREALVALHAPVIAAALGG